MPCGKACCPCIEGEAQEHLPAVGQHHDERHQRPLCAADAEVSERPPVDLGLFTRKGAKTQVGLGHAPWSQPRDPCPEVTLAAGVATRTNHMKEPGGGERRVVGQCLRDEGQKRIDH